jgi:hypothetical protein
MNKKDMTPEDKDNIKMLTAVIGVLTIPTITGLTALHWAKFGGGIGHMALILAGGALIWLSIRFIRAKTAA